MAQFDVTVTSLIYPEPIVASCIYLLLLVFDVFYRGNTGIWQSDICLICSCLGNIFTLNHKIQKEKNGYHLKQYKVNYVKSKQKHLNCSLLTF